MRTPVKASCWKPFRRETQERIAREEFGMVRGDREILYRFVDTAVTGRAR